MPNTYDAFRPCAKCGHFAVLSKWCDAGAAIGGLMPCGERADTILVAEEEVLNMDHCSYTDCPAHEGYAEDELPHGRYFHDHMHRECERCGYRCFEYPLE